MWSKFAQLVGKWDAHIKKTQRAKASPPPEFKNIYKTLKNQRVDINLGPSKKTTISVGKIKAPLVPADTYGVKLTRKF